jgi:hypothetical protein
VWYRCIRAAPVRGELSIAFSYSRMWCSPQLTTELSDAGGPARPLWQLRWLARIRSSDFVRQQFHGPLQKYMPGFHSTK